MALLFVPWPARFYQEALALTLEHEGDISDFEGRHNAWMPAAG